MTGSVGLHDLTEPADGWAVVVPVGYRVGRWEVTAPIATGSWGSVYAARAVEPGGAGTASGPGSEPVALKFLPTGTATPRMLDHLARIARRERLRHEQLDHPALVLTHEVLTVDDPANPVLDGCMVVVMERAERSLADDVRAGPLPPARAAAILSRLAEGLAHLHARGWVHGDLKPSNVLVMADGSIRLADFGMATQLDGTHGYSPPFGSPDYRPPEHRAAGLSSDGLVIRPTADVWALGITAHELLTGRHPFPGTTAWDRAAAADAYAAGSAPLHLDARLPDGLRSVIADCLGADHAVRARHPAHELAGRFQAAGDGTPKAGPGGTSEAEPGTTGRRAGRRPGVRWVVGAGGGLLGAALLLPGLSGVPLPGRDGGAPGRAPQPAQGRTRLDENAGIPARYRQMIIAAGTTCPERPAVTPGLVAAILKVESNFDPGLSDPRHDEFGIARWTPRVLRYYLPPGEQSAVPVPPFPPEMSIPAVGRFLCHLDTAVDAQLPGDRGGLLAAAYRTSSATVNQAHGVPARLRAYVDQVIVNRDRYASSPSA